VFVSLNEKELIKFGKSSGSGSGVCDLRMLLFASAEPDVAEHPPVYPVGTEFETGQYDGCSIALHADGADKLRNLRTADRTL